MYEKVAKDLYIMHKEDTGIDSICMFKYVIECLTPAIKHTGFIDNYTLLPSLRILVFKSLASQVYHTVRKCSEFKVHNLAKFA